VHWLSLLSAATALGDVGTTAAAGCVRRRALHTAAAAAANHVNCAAYHDGGTGFHPRRPLRRRSHATLLLSDLLIGHSNWPWWLRKEIA
jgi:hypothetical protein